MKIKIQSNKTSQQIEVEKRIYGEISAQKKELLILKIRKTVSGQPQTTKQKIRRDIARKLHLLTLMKIGKK
jgi:ribosomal protein L29